jgi:hypothetical protein
MVRVNIETMGKHKLHQENQMKQLKENIEHLSKISSEYADKEQKLIDNIK